MEDVSSLCEAIDNTRWPELDGKTVVESIWPSAAKRGLRLSSYAAWIYGQYNKNEVRAAEIFNVIRWLFCTNEDSEGLAIAEAQIAYAIEATRSGVGIVGAEH